MTPHELAVAIENRRREMQADIFNVPPQNYDDFVKRLGVWMGLGEALGIIEDARKKERDDE